MADPSSSQSRLTVLSGPLAGRELVLDDVVDNILVGSDPSCRFHLDAPGISPIHARLWMDASGVTVYDTGSENGLYVNDDRVSGQAPLRNGDILWLGTPGSDEVIMIQCRLPTRAAPVAPAPPAPAPAPQPREIEETMVIVPDEGAPVFPVGPIEEDTASLFAITPPEEPAEVAYEAVGEAADLVSDEEPALEAVEDEPATLVATRDDEVTFGETQAIENPEDATAAMAPPPAPEPEGPGVKFALDYEDQPPAFAVPEAPPPVFEDETESPTVMVTREAPLEQTMSMPFTAPEPEPTVMAPIEVPVEPPAPPPPPPPPPPPKPAPAAAPPPPKPRPATPPLREPRPPRPEPSPTPPPARGEGGSGAGRYAAMGVGGLVVLGILGYVGMRFMGGGGKASPAPPVTTPTTMAVAPPTTQAPAPPTTEAAAPVVDEVVTIVKTPPPTTMAPAPSPVSKATPTPAPVTAKGPSPAPTPVTKGPTPTVATQPPGPSAEAARAQQVATLLGHADAAAGSHSYDQAAGLYDEALKLDPGNAKASSGKSAAIAAAAAFKKTFVSGKTVVSGGKGAKALSGFDSEDVSVSKAPDYSGRIEFEVAPRNVKPGDSYSVKVFLTNDGKKSFKIGSLTLTTTANGSKTGGPAAASVREVQPQQRVSLQETSGTWQDGTNSWNLEVAVVSDHGDTFKNTVTWR